MKILSFCITTYNQSGLLRDSLEAISKVDSDEIEVVINDDCSSEDIESVVKGFDDKRFKFYRNKANLGHDRNIIKSIENAEGEFVFVLRARDRICSESIPGFIKVLKESRSSYIACSAVNENGKIVLPFRDKVYKAGAEAVNAHFKLFIHPSGNIYRRASIDTGRLEEFLDEEGVGKLGFIVHSMIRVGLSQKDSFQTVSNVVWIYANTNKAKDVAQNKTGTGVSVYHPSLTFKRFGWEYKWLKLCIRNDFEDVLMHLIEITLDSLTWNFMLSNGDKKSQNHYQYKKADYSLRKTREKFYKKCKELYDDINVANDIDIAGETEEPRKLETNKISDVSGHSGKEFVSYDEYIRRLDKVFRRNITHGGPKFVIRYLTNNTRAYDVLSNFYKTYIRRL